MVGATDAGANGRGPLAGLRLRSQSAPCKKDNRPAKSSSQYLPVSSARSSALRAHTVAPAPTVAASSSQVHIFGISVAPMRASPGRAEIGHCLDSSRQGGCGQLVQSGGDPVEPGGDFPLAIDFQSVAAADLRADLRGVLADAEDKLAHVVCDTRLAGWNATGPNPAKTSARTQTCQCGLGTLGRSDW